MAVGSLVVFIICAVVAVFGAWRMITSHHPVHSALYLVLCFAATAVVYLLLGAPFVAVLQIAVYAGAIMVLFLFVIMYLNLGLARDVLDDRRRRIVVGVAAGALGLLVLMIALFGGGLGQAVKGPMPYRVEDIGVALCGPFALPFEAASVQLLVAMVGVMTIARPELRREADRREAAGR
jgi:NADH-quinone oxidoreductase subunit J